MSSNIILELRDISKNFPGVKALDRVNLTVETGETHALVGENGAGKSTLIKILSGAIIPDEGLIFYNQREIKQLNPLSAMNLGIQTIYQEHTLFPMLSVVDNLFAGKEYTRGNLIIDSVRMEKRAKEVLEYLQSDINLKTMVKNLSSGQQKIVEIARGLIQESKLIILDEPTSSFSQHEISILFNILNKLKDNNISIIYISHHLEEVFKIADRVTVIRDGKNINTYAMKDLTEKQLIKDMIGRDLSVFIKRNEFLKKESLKEDVVLEAKNLCGNGVKNASIYVRKGELLGIAGMVGSGRTELAELLFGAKKLNSGEIKIKGKKVNISSPKVAIANKICFIPEDRQSKGLFLMHSILQNSVIVFYSKIRTILAIPRNDAKITKEYVNKLNIVAGGIYQIIVSLSGGNQQKVVLAKWFMTNGEIFIFDEPTRGIDIGAKQEIYKLMSDILKEGKSIIMISSDMVELIAMSDRVSVMRNMEIVAELQRENISEENILKNSIGSESND